MHHLQFSKQPPQDRSEGGYRIKATKSNFPVLKGMSLYKLILLPKALREPHWHANADELGYCISGKVLVSFYANGNHREKFLISEGETFFIPSGTLHSLENIGDDNVELVLQFSHEEPEDFGLSTAFGMFSDSVLGNTWGVPADHFHSVRRSTKDTFIAKLTASSQIHEEDRYHSPYQYNLELSTPVVSTGEGDAKVARGNVWPILKRQSLYSLVLANTGMREPHWHPETAELGYVHSGKGRMSILSPSGTVETYTMEGGDIYFIPKAYPHHIENLGSSDLRILIFFDQVMPGDIGFTASVKSFPPEALAAILHSKSEVFEQLPQYYEDRFIVKKVNPVDVRATNPKKSIVAERL